jgi:hypothetical protein
VDKTLIARALDDDYARLATRERVAPKPPQDMTAVFDEFTPVSDSEGRDRDNIRRFTASKGFDIGALVTMDVRFKTTRAGEVYLAYPVRCGPGADHLNQGTVVGVKLRSCQTGRKLCEPGTRLSWPAMPSLYGAGDPDRIYVCEGESDAAWLLAHGDLATDVYCLHGGAALWDARWAIPLVSAKSEGVKVLVATDNDHDRPTDVLGIQNIGEQLARKIMADVPGSKRLKPPMPARDWCEVRPS